MTYKPSASITWSGVYCKALLLCISIYLFAIPTIIMVCSFLCAGLCGSIEVCLQYEEASSTLTVTVLRCKVTHTTSTRPQGSYPRAQATQDCIWFGGSGWCFMCLASHACMQLKCMPTCSSISISLAMHVSQLHRG